MRHARGDTGMLPLRPVKKQNRAMAQIQIFEKKKMNNGKCSRSLLFERNTPFWSDLQLKFSIAVGEAEKQEFHFFKKKLRILK